MPNLKLRRAALTVGLCAAALSSLSISGPAQASSWLGLTSSLTVAAAAVQQLDGEDPPADVPPPDAAPADAAPPAVDPPADVAPPPDEAPLADVAPADAEQPAPVADPAPAAAPGAAQPPAVPQQPALPDLSVTIRDLGQVTPFTYAHTFACTVKNTGGTDSGLFTTRVWLTEPSGRFGTLHTTGLQEFAMQVPAGQERTINYQSILRDTQTLHVTADFYNTVAESNEKNNTAAVDAIEAPLGPGDWIGHLLW